MGSGSSRPPFVKTGDAVPTEHQAAVEEDVYKQVYRQAQVDTLSHLQTQTDKAIQTAVDAKLKKAEESEARELAAASAELEGMARRAPMRPLKCTKERNACLACYKQNGAVDPLVCRPLVDALEACTETAVKQLIWRGAEVKE